MPGLNLIQTVGVAADLDVAEEVQEFARQMWKYLAAKTLRPSHGQVQLDNSAVVLTMKSEEDRDAAMRVFKEDEDFTITQSNMPGGAPTIRCEDWDFDLRLSVSAQATAC